MIQTVLIIVRNKKIYKDVKDICILFDRERKLFGSKNKKTN